MMQLLLKTAFSNLLGQTEHGEGKGGGGEKKKKEKQKQN